jgi:TolA-binding protein
MQKPLLSLLAFTVAAAAWSPVAAQEAPPMPAPAASTAPTTTTPTTTTTTTTQQNPGQPNFGQLMSSLNRMKAEVAQVRSLRMLSTNDVHIIKVQSIAGTDTAALNNALTKNAADIASLRNALSRVQLMASTDRHTLTFAEFLADNKLSINQVVAADVSNGALTAFIQ